MNRLEKIDRFYSWVFRRWYVVVAALYAFFYFTG